MKATTVFMTGLITCTTVLHAQSDSSNSPSGNDKPSSAAPVFNQEILWTDSMVHPFSDRHGFAERISIKPAANLVPGSDLSATNMDYQVIVLPRGETTPEVAGNEIETAGAAAATAHSADRFSEADFLYWQYGIPRPTQSTRQKETGRQRPIQHLYIEPLGAPRGTALDEDEFSEIKLVYIPPKLAWHEWLNPRVFIPRWAELWTTETDAAPVVLVMASF